MTLQFLEHVSNLAGCKVACTDSLLQVLVMSPTLSHVTNVCNLDFAFISPIFNDLTWKDGRSTCSDIILW